MKNITNIFKNNPVFTTSFILAGISILFGNLNLEFIKFNIIFTLFGMMLVLIYFENSMILNKLATLFIVKSKNTRNMVQKVLIFSFISSFFLSNDVTVLTILPIYLKMISMIDNFKGRIVGAALIPVASNMGGIFFPFSNPQNLIIFDSFEIGLLDFISVTGPIMVLGFVLIILMTFAFVEKKKTKLKEKHYEIDKSLVLQGSIGLTLMILCVFSILPVYSVVAIISIYTLLRYSKFFKSVDYTLLLTFVFFFIIVNNISSIKIVKDFIENNLSTAKSTMIGSITLSQVMSNVPTTILMIPYISSPKALLFGVNIGGLGTMLASLTNLIGFDLFAQKMPYSKNKFLLFFTIANFAMILIFVFVFIWFV